MKRLTILTLMVLAFTILSVTLALAQDDAQPEVTFTLYRDEESLTFYFSGVGEISFHTIRIDVFLPNGTVDEIYLQNYATFETLLIRRALQAPTCLRLELRDTDVPFPDDCRVLSSQQRRVEDNIGRSGIFWYEDEINEYFALELYQEDVFIGDCAADLVEDEVCEVTFVPSAMPEYVPPTPRPTATVQMATPVPMVSSRSYPCEAIVYSTSGSTRLNVVRRSPNPAFPVIASIVTGDLISVQDTSSSQGNVWYLINDTNGRNIGWVESVYLRLSGNCP